MTVKIGEDEQTRVEAEADEAPEIYAIKKEGNEFLLSRRAVGWGGALLAS